MRTKRKVGFLPKGYHAVTPYLACEGASAAIAFYRKAFGARELMRMPGPGGRIGHAEVEIGGSRVMLADEHPEIGFLGPRSRGGSAVHIHLFVKDVDAVVGRSVAAGAKLVREVADQFYGDRSGSVEDPFGHVWHLATHVRDVSMAQMRKGAARKVKDVGG